MHECQIKHIIPVVFFHMTEGRSSTTTNLALRFIEVCMVVILQHAGKRMRLFAIEKKGLSRGRKLALSGLYEAIVSVSPNDY